MLAGPPPGWAGHVWLETRDLACQQGPWIRAATICFSSLLLCAKKRGTARSYTNTLHKYSIAAARAVGKPRRVGHGAARTRKAGRTSEGGRGERKGRGLASELVGSSAGRGRQVSRSPYGYGTSAAFPHRGPYLNQPVVSPLAVRRPTAWKRPSGRRTRDRGDDEKESPPLSETTILVPFPELAPPTSPALERATEPCLFSLVAMCPRVHGDGTWSRAPTARLRA